LKRDGAKLLQSEFCHWNNLTELAVERDANKRKPSWLRSRRRRRRRLLVIAYGLRY
jgi:hypothetical protein